LEKSLKIIFNVEFYRYYSSRDGVNLYWPYQEYGLLSIIEDYAKQEKSITEKISSLNARLITEKGLIEREKIQKKITKLDVELRRIKRNKVVLEDWDKIDEDGKDNHLDVMEILDKDTVLSPTSNIEPNTADLFAFIIDHKAFDYVKTNVDPCETLGRISLNDRKELVKKIVSAYDDECFGKFVDNVIDYRRKVSILPEIASLAKLETQFDDNAGEAEQNCNGLSLILYPIMYPHKYMILRNAYYMILGEKYYSDDDAYNMLINNKKPYITLPEAGNWKKKELQLNWIIKLIISRMDSSTEVRSNYEPLDDMPENIKQFFEE
jgi:hypothetical protein